MVAITVTDETQRVWPIAGLRANPHNPRQITNDESIQELADSIRAQGILQPLLVTPSGVVVAGHRRLAAARLVGLSDVPVIVREMSESEQVEAILVENLQRQDLSPIQAAESYQRLLDMGMAQSEVARRIGKHVVSVTNYLKLLTLDGQVQDLIDGGKLSMYAALELMPLDGPRQWRIAKMAVLRRMGQARVRKLVLDFLGDYPKLQRANRRRQEIAQPTTDRGAMLAKLAKQSGSLSWDRVKKAAYMTCERCDMNSELVCSECVVTELLAKLVGE